MTGKVASGKTTYARQKEKNENAVVLSVDELQLSIFGPTPTRDQIDSTYEGARDYQLVVAQKFLNNGLDVYLDWGLWGRFERAEIKQKILQLGYDVKVIYFQVPDEIRREWNSKRNEGMDGASFKIEGSS
jgi:predicted kinase